MVLRRKAQRGRRTDLFMLGIIVFVRAFRHLGQWQIGQAEHQLVQLLAGSLLLLAGGFNRFLGVGNFIPEAFELCLVAAGLGLANQLGIGVTSAFGFLLVGERLTKGRVMGQDVIDLVAQPGRPPVPGVAEVVRVFADGADVERDWSRTGGESLSLATRLVQLARQRNRPR